MFQWKASGTFFLCVASVQTAGSNTSRIKTEVFLLRKVHPVKKKLQQNLALPQIQWAVLSKMCQPAAHSKYTVVAVQYRGQIHSHGVF